MIKNYKLKLVSLLFLCFPCLFHAMNNDKKTQAIVVVLKDPEFPDYESLEKDYEFITYNTQEYKDQNEEYRKEAANHYCDSLGYKNPYFNASEEEVLKYWQATKKYDKEVYSKPDNKGHSYYRPFGNYSNCLFASKIREIKRVLEEKKLNDLKKRLKQIEDKMIEVVGEQKYERRMKNLTYSILMFFKISNDQKKSLSEIKGVSNVFFAKNVKWDELEEFRKAQKKSLLETEKEEFDDAIEKSLKEEFDDAIEKSFHDEKK